MSNALSEAEEARSKETSTALMVIGEKLALAYKDFSVGFRNTNTAGHRMYNSLGYRQGAATGKNLRIGLKTLKD
jgi:hypothetical protein